MRPLENYYPKSIFTSRYPGFEEAAQGLEAAHLIGEAEGARESGRLDETCLVHSFFGEMTVAECLQLAAWHFQRHFRGVKRATTH
ncbi:MAG: hypothetical protein WD273_14925 [Trueperaceae bacterium]